MKSPAGYVGLVRRTLKRFSSEQMTDRAAALTYFAVLSLFPGLIVFAAVLGIFGDPQATTRAVTEIAADLAPGTGVDSVGNVIIPLTESKGTAGAMLIVGLLTGLWSASGYIGGLTRAANQAYRTDEERPFWKLRPLQLGLTLVAVVVLALVAVALVLTGSIVDAVAGPLGIGEQTLAVWAVAKWPVVVLLVAALLTLLFFAAPDAARRSVGAVLPGVALALLVWLIASAAFFFYVANFGSYNKTYGALGGAVSMLVWMWLSNSALLLGVTLNAEIAAERGVASQDVQVALDVGPVPGSVGDSPEVHR